jgi:ABC-type transport system involved in multi-copper enzyme maturation permease subunit
MSWWGPVGVAWFELRRSFSPGRLALWLLMVGFPVVLTGMIRYLKPDDFPREAYTIILFALIVRVACVMGLLLWVTPLISSELEGRTWVYLVSRPTVSRSVVFGKYLVGICWAISAGIAAASLAVPLSGLGQAAEVWKVMCGLVVMGSFAYGSLFAFIGTLVQRRAMVAAIVYVVFVEGVISLVPATINRFTVGYRLLSLLGAGLQIEGEDARTRMLIEASTPAFHIAILLTYAVVLLLLAVGRVRLGGYLTAPED